MGEVGEDPAEFSCTDMCILATCRRAASSPAPPARAPVPSAAARRAAPAAASRRAGRWPHGWRSPRTARRRLAGALRRLGRARSDTRAAGAAWMSCSFALPRCWSGAGGLRLSCRQAGAATSPSPARSRRSAAASGRVMPGWSAYSGARPRAGRICVEYCALTFWRLRLGRHVAPAEPRAEIGMAGCASSAVKAEP